MGNKRESFGGGVAVGDDLKTFLGWVGMAAYFQMSAGLISAPKWSLHML